MWQLAQEEGSAAVAVVEDPNEVVRQIERLGPANPRLAAALTVLGVDRLTDLNTQTQNALQQVRRDGKSKTRNGLYTVVEVFRRGLQFGD